MKRGHHDGAAAHAARSAFAGIGASLRSARRLATRWLLAGGVIAAAWVLPQHTLTWPSARADETRLRIGLVEPRVAVFEAAPARTDSAPLPAGSVHARSAAPQEARAQETRPTPLLVAVATVPVPDRKSVV